MEGKAVLFKKFAGIDVFDIELNESDPHKLVEVIAALEPTFGGINLEDIKAPDCFIVERECRKRMKIPVFHDDQHGTAIVVAAAITNGLKVVGKDIKKVKLVSSGAGAAALACLDLLVDIGLPLENITVTDLAGVVYKGRVELMDPDKERFARETDARTLAEAIGGADIFLGLSAGGVLKQDMVKQMADKPLILALANPTPEILPELALEVRPDAVLCTGRTDYPNQVNNVLVFPFLFRGALDAGATTVTREMEIAAVNAIAELARQEQSDIVATAYGIQDLSFGPEYLIPKPFDPRLIVKVAPAVAKAAMDSRRRRASDRGHGSVRTASAAVRVSQRHDHEADFPAGAWRRAGEEAHRVRGRRRRARAARDADHRRRKAREADPDRPSGGDRTAHRALRPASGRGAGLHGRQHRS